MTRSLNLFAFVGVLSSAYRRVFHPWQDRWGATDEELVVPAGRRSPRRASGTGHTAIEIGAPPDAVWL